MTVSSSLDEHDGVTGAVQPVLLRTAGRTAEHALLIGRGQPASLPRQLGHHRQVQTAAWQVDVAEEKILAGPGRSQEQEHQEQVRWHGAGQEVNEALSLMACPVGVKCKVKFVKFAAAE